MLKLERTLRTLWHYAQNRRLRLKSRAEVELHQMRRLGEHLSFLEANSAHFRELLAPSAGRSPHERLSSLPLVDKSAWLQSFDRSNTRGLTLVQAQQAALRAETDRDFSPTVNGCTVGLSSGTSGSRGVFVVSPQEQAQWAGVILAKLLPRGLFASERVAFFLRANSNLYTAVRSRWLTFEFFDLFQSFEDHLARLRTYRPTIIVAPAQVLRALALSPDAAQWAHCTVISVAEVLDESTRAVLEEHFAAVREVYQATEGLLATSCEHGRLHLNEEHLVVERQYLDAERFVPVITDLSRTTQPLVRYRLNDVLRASHEDCPCGRRTGVIAAIEGRCDDQLALPGKPGATMTVFADAVSRAIARSLPLASDYEVLQTGAADITLRTSADLGATEVTQRALDALFEGYGVDTSALAWTLQAHQAFSWEPGAKRRRIRNLYRARP